MNRPRAFTLIEVMLSLVILVILASSIGWAVREMRDKTMVLRRASEDLTISTSLFDLLDASITNSVALNPVDGSAGIRGTPESIDIVSRGVLADLDAEASSLAGLTRLRINFDPQSPELTVGRASASSAASMQPVSERIEFMRFRYHDGQQWSDSFDSRDQGRLPLAVEVSVWFVTALDERAEPADPDQPSTIPEDAPEADPFEFDGMGAPVRSDIEQSSETPQRRPDRYRIFSVLDAPQFEEAPADFDFPTGGAQ